MKGIGEFMRIFNYVAVAAFALSCLAAAPAFADNASYSHSQAVYVAHEGCRNCGKCDSAEKKCNRDCANCPKKCGMKSLNLTEEQQKQAKEIFKRAGMAKADVLTDEQKEAIKKFKASKKSEGSEGTRHMGGHPNHPGHMGFPGDPHHMGGHHRHGHMGMPGVELTDEQKAKFRAIDEKAMKDKEALMTDEQKEQMAKFRAIDEKVMKDKEALLTDEQKAQMKKFHERPDGKKMGHRGKSRVPGVELSDEQKAKMKEIQKKADAEFRSILTDEQKKIFDSSRKGKRK